MTAGGPLDKGFSPTNIRDSSRPGRFCLERDSDDRFERKDRQELTMSTYMPKPGEIQGDWHVIDATDQVLGRLAARIALIIQGKNKPTYTPHVDTGDFVIVLNADKVKVTGR